MTNQLGTQGNNITSVMYNFGVNNLTLPANTENLTVERADYSGLVFGASSTTLLQDITLTKVLYYDVTKTKFYLRYYDNNTLTFLEATT